MVCLFWFLSKDCVSFSWPLLAECAKPLRDTVTYCTNKTKQLKSQLQMQDSSLNILLHARDNSHVSVLAVNKVNKIRVLVMYEQPLSYYVGTSCRGKKISLATVKLAIFVADEIGEVGWRYVKDHAMGIIKSDEKRYWLNG